MVSTAPLFDVPFVFGTAVGSAGAGSALSKKGFVDIGRGLVWPVVILFRNGLLEASGDATRSKMN